MLLLRRLLRKTVHLLSIRNPQSAIRNPQSAIRNPQSAIRNRKILNFLRQPSLSVRSRTDKT